MQIEEKNIEQPKYVLQCKEKIGMFFLRSLWIYLIYILTIVILKIYQGKIVQYIPNIEFIDANSLYNLTAIALLVITTVIYLKVSVSSYNKTKSRKCSFFDNYLVYENPYALIKTKDVTYENINKVVVDKNILDYIFKTGTIRIHKAVEYDEGMAIGIIKEPQDILNDIKDITKINY